MLCQNVPPFQAEPYSIVWIYLYRLSILCQWTLELSSPSGYQEWCTVTSQCPWTTNILVNLGTQIVCHIKSLNNWERNKPCDLCDTSVHNSLLKQATCDARGAAGKWEPIYFCHLKVPLRVCVCAKLLQSCLTLVTQWTVTHQVPLSIRFSRQEYWNGLPFPPPGELPNPGTEPASLMSPALADGFFTTSTTREAQRSLYRVAIALSRFWILSRLLRTSAQSYARDLSFMWQIWERRMCY